MIAQNMATFLFKWRQEVIIHTQGIDYHGTVNRIIFDGGPMPVYQVRYIADGEFRYGEFYEDDLKAKGA